MAGGMLGAAAGRGDIPADVDFGGLVTMLMVIADGVWGRRALGSAFDPNSAFDPRALLAIFMDVARHMPRGRRNHNGHGAPQRRANDR
jgi:TetR/AcrR family transcriptional regulator, repressor for uid operon